jgi:ATP adenylyltransferase
VDATDDAAIATGGNGKKVDPFMPYNINLHVGDLKDEESQEEFVVLVRKIVLPKIFFH